MARIESFFVDPQAMEILEGYGINVKGAIVENMIRQDHKPGVTREGRLVGLRGLDTRDVMTSELLQLAECVPDDRSLYLAELDRRLRLLDLSQPQVNAFIGKELTAIANKVSAKPELRMASPGKYIMDNTTIESLPKVNQCSASDLIQIVDDAQAAFWYDHEWLPDEAFEAVCYAGSCINGSKPSPYITELNQRLSDSGWQEWQRSMFTRNECRITERSKWGYKPDQDSWTEQTIQRS